MLKIVGSLDFTVKNINLRLSCQIDENIRTLIHIYLFYVNFKFSVFVFSFAYFPQNIQYHHTNL